MNELKEESSIGFWMIFNVVAISLIVLVGFPNFVGRVHDGRQKPSCISNLRQMNAAIQQWALGFGKQPQDRITMLDITHYLKNATNCPQGGKYTIGPAVSNAPSCSLPGHMLLR